MQWIKWVWLLSADRRWSRCQCANVAAVDALLTHTRCEAHHLCQLRQQGGTITNTTNSNKHSMHTCTHKPRRAGNTCDLQIHSACAMQQCIHNSSAMQAARAVLVDTASSPGAPGVQAGQHTSVLRSRIRAGIDSRAREAVNQCTA